MKVAACYLLSSKVWGDTGAVRALLQADDETGISSLLFWKNIPGVYFQSLQWIIEMFWFAISFVLDHLLLLPNYYKFLTYFIPLMMCKLANSLRLLVIVLHFIGLVNRTAVVLPYRMKTNTEINLGTWVRMVKLKELIVSKFWILECIYDKLSLQGL